MNQRIKIFIVEYDCVSLITLMLWLDQFADLDVLGTTVDTGSLRSQIDDLKPDVVLLDIATPGPEDVPQLRECKSVEPPPAVLLLYHGDPDGLEGPLKAESEGQLGPETSMSELYDSIVRAASLRRLMLSAALLPAMQAG